MVDFQSEKKLVRNWISALETAPETDIAENVGCFVSESYRWRGCHPFNEIKGFDQVADRFWKPLKSALRPLRRREDIFFGGLNQIDGFQSVWVVSMGHFYGLLDKPWLGVQPTGKMAFLRFCEFHRVEGGKIVETAMFFDIPHLMIQAGLRPFPSQSAAHLVQPGPATHDGLLFDPELAERGERTLTLINRMIADLGQWRSGLPLEQELARTWHDDMIWWGPAGIGATYTIERYARQHAGLFRGAFSDRSATSHIARLAEGAYGGFFGWPNFSARQTGEFMGRSASGKMADFRVIDIYRRDGEKLAENWVFIDFLHFSSLQGVDLLA